jgi:tRNA dimethylallyltransferase
MGPTATGKTQLSLELAEQFPIEIISVDSAMVYQGLDIGSGKPTLEEQALVPHHLLSIRSPENPYSVANFREDASRLIREISARGNIPFLVGGTMLYFKALIQGLSPLPPQDPVYRAVLLERGKEEGWAVLHEELAALDPVAAEKIRPTDLQRIQRALEVIYLTNKTLSEQFDQPMLPSDSVRWCQIALSAEERTTLHTQIAKRFDVMCQQGFVEEVRQLQQNPQLHPDLPAIRSVGYRQIWAYLDGLGTEVEMKEQTLAATRQLAKRQMTWLRHWLEEIYSLDWQEPARLQKIGAVLQSFLAKE